MYTSGNSVVTNEGMKTNNNNNNKKNKKMKTISINFESSLLSGFGKNIKLAIMNGIIVAVIGCEEETIQCE